MQRLPDSLLEQAAANVEWQLQTQAGRLDHADHLRHPALEFGVGPHQLGLAEALLDLLHQRLGRIAQEDGADALGTAGDQDRAQRTLPDGEADTLPAATLAILAGTHSEQARRIFIESAAGTEAGVVECLGHRGALLQPLAQTPGTPGPRIALGRHAGHAAEQPMKLPGTQAGGFGQRSQARFARRLLDLPAGPRHAFGAALCRRTITSGLGQLGAVEEFDITRIGQTLVRPRPQVDAAPTQRIDESARYGTRRGGLQRLPARVLLDG